MHERLQVACSARRYARIRQWYTLTEVAKRWGVSRQAAHERALARRVRVERDGAHRTAPLRLAACCVEAEASADVCDCRAVLAEVERRRAG